jgi:hypothetical protein
LCLHPILTACLPASKSTETLNFIYEVRTVLGFLVFSFDFEVLCTEFVAK